MENHITFPLLGACANSHAVSGVRLHLGANELPTESGNVVDRVLKVLSAGLERRLCAAPIPSELLFGICRAVQGSSVMDDLASSIMPRVLSILRPWRILDEKIRYASQELRTLALELAGIRHQGIPHEAASGDINEASTGSPHRNIEGVHVEQTTEANSKPLETTALIRSEDIPWPRLANISSSSLKHKVTSSLPISLCPISPRPHGQTSSSEYRSGCAACRRPRDSSASPPETPLTPREPIPGTRTGALPASRASVLSVCPYSNQNKPSTMRSAEADENTPPLPPRRASTNSGIGLQRSRTPSKASFSFPRSCITSQIRPPSVTAGHKVQLHPDRPRVDDIASHQSKGINWRASGRASSNSCRSRTQDVSQTQIRRAGAFTTSESGPRGRRSLGITAELSDKTNRLSSASDSRCRAFACSDKRCLRHSLQPARRISTIDPQCSHAGAAHH